MGLTIRECTSDDAGALVPVLFGAFDPLRANYTDAAIAKTIGTPEAMRERIAEGPVWIAELDGRAVGTVSIVEYGDRLYLRGMGVLPDTQGHGVGKALLARAMAHARQHKASKVFLHTTPFLRPAIALYESFGFRRTEEGPNEWEGTPIMCMEVDLDGA